MTHKTVRTLKILLGIAHFLVLRRGRGGPLALWPARTAAGPGSRPRLAPARAACGPVLLLAGVLVPGSVSAQDAGPVRLTLAEALTRAEAASEQVAIADAAVLRAQGGRHEARSGLLPKLGATIGYVRTLESEYEGLGGAAADTGSSPFEGLELPFGQANRYDLGVTATQTVFAGGRVLAQNRIAGSGVRSAELGVAEARAQLALDVTRAFYDASLSDRLVGIAEASLAQAEQTLVQVRAGQRVGEKAEFETLRAQVARDNQRPQVIQRRTERDLAYMRLKQLVNLGEADSVVLVVNANLVASAPGPEPSALGAGPRVHPEAVPEVAVSDVDFPMPLTGSASAEQASGAWVHPGDTAVHHRGAVRQAQEAVRVRENLARIAGAQRLPSVAVTTTYGRVGYPRGGLPRWAELRSNWTVGVQLEVPLFTGGRIRGETLRAEADVAEARAQLDRTRELAALDARAALERVAAAEAVWQASTGTVEQAAKAYRIAELRYREGLSTQLELNDARLMLQQADANRAVAERDLEVARAVVRLLPDLPLGQGTI
jgi:outer membrane protein TolC